MTSPAPPPPPGDYPEASDDEMAVDGEEERKVWSPGTFPSTPLLDELSGLSYQAQGGARALKAARELNKIQT